ncbi:MAG: nucleoside triphosphate pyrophosphohydrolase family protein [Nanoarchaeota archaeon]
MEYKEYAEKSKRTCPNLQDNLRKGLADEMHMVIGISTEAGELLDAYKKHFAYGKNLDKINVEEEIADIMWYISNLCRILEISFEDILQKNIDKLKARFPEKFDELKALKRNLEIERKILEGNKSLSTN